MNRRFIAYTIITALFALWGFYAFIGFFFSYHDIYPRNLMDARIWHAIRLQRDSGYVSLPEATPFDWDVVYFIPDIPLADDREELEAVVGADLRELRTFRTGPFDRPMGFCMIFLKDGEFAAHFIPFANLYIVFPPEKSVAKGLRLEGVAMLTREEAYFRVNADGRLVWEAQNEQDAE